MIEMVDFDESNQMIQNTNIYWQKEGVGKRKD